MLLIQNKRVNWDSRQIGIPGATAKDKENRRIPFNPKGRFAAILGRRATLGPGGVRVRHRNRRPTSRTSRPPGKPCGSWRTASIRCREGRTRNGIANSSQRIDLRWHDLRHEGACRLLADGVDIRIIQLMLGHASIQQTQRYLNVTDEELQERTGGELEQQRPTASLWHRVKLIDLVSF